ncbi:MAG TPA: hypothetical protein VFY29_09165 [Terriglobia bacterium]|nr:hypothetical protein [Terriglobia bacterium]
MKQAAGIGLRVTPERPLHQSLHRKHNGAPPRVVKESKNLRWQDSGR